MRVVITCERRFYRTPDGGVWTSSSNDYTFWERYLTVFSNVLIISRIKDVRDVNSTWKSVVGPKVQVEGLPNYSGPFGFLIFLASIIFHLLRIVHRNDAVILRIPSHIAFSLGAVVKIRKQPYGAEVVGNIYTALAPESVKHLLRPLLQYLAVRIVRDQCWNASSIAYVTEYTLQKLFPPSSHAFVTHYSSISLPDSYVLQNPRKAVSNSITIIAVGSMSRRYKRFDVLLEAVEECILDGLDLQVLLIGDGQDRIYFEKVAQNLGVRVKFLGELPGSDAVREQLLKADLFILPSVNEGLPRVIIEAMAVGLPCIGTTVGGTPELLPPEDLVPPADVKALSAKIREVVTDHERMHSMSVRNLNKAKQYTDSELRLRRDRMYSALRQSTVTGE